MAINISGVQPGRRALRMMTRQSGGAARTRNLLLSCREMFLIQQESVAPASAPKTKSVHMHLFRLLTTSKPLTILLGYSKVTESFIWSLARDNCVPLFNLGQVEWVGHIGGDAFLVFSGDPVLNPKTLRRSANNFCTLEAATAVSEAIASGRAS